MSDSGEMLKIHAAIEVPAGVLTAVVENAKQKYGASKSGVYHIDTAEELNRIITRFLKEKDFPAYVKDPSNY